MEIKFTKNGEKFVSEFTATADFNLHLEGVVEGKVKVYQRSTAGGEYAYVRAATPYPSFSKVYDYDFSALVYPKYIKVVTDVEPEYAEVVTDGEVTEIKSQSKEIEVTSNGTTEVAPDTGFAYLNSVKVKTNVSSSGGGARNIKYYDVTRIDSEGKLGFIYYANASKTPDTIFGAAYLIPMAIDGGLNQEFANRVTAVALDFDSIIIKTAEEEQRVEAVKDFIFQFDITEITEEEFYNLNVEV
jgi:hypothetical protein